MSTSAAAPPASTSEALAMLTSAMTYLAAADATQLTASEQAECDQRDDAAEDDERDTAGVRAARTLGRCSVWLGTHGCSPWYSRFCL